MSPVELARCARRADRVCITRDNWGIAHIEADTDANAVFGLMYAQAEDDFARIEHHYLIALGRLAEVEGKHALFHDLRARLFNDRNVLVKHCEATPSWLRCLLEAWADGLNYFLAKHVDVTPRLLERFEPWMALSFTEGGILGDIGRIPLDDFESFYGGEKTRGATVELSPDEMGSNAFAVAPQNTREGSALLFINPHPDLFFRTEIHVRSAEGLNCYGAATWGQFLIYQGFNDHVGWAHTTSGAGTVDEYRETIAPVNGVLSARHGTDYKPLEIRDIDLWFKTSKGARDTRRFRTYRSTHGPIIRAENDRWISIAMMQKPVEALMQGFLRMKANSYSAFVEAGELKANSITNCVYADRKGNIAFWPPQFMPRRDDSFDYTLPVDGSDPASDWQGEHDLADLPSLLNPATGWIKNVNDSPFAVSGSSSPSIDDYPAYIDTSGENPRSASAATMLQSDKSFTLERLVERSYDPYLSTFDRLVPWLAQNNHPVELGSSDLEEAVALLLAWDCRCSTNSVETTIAVAWGEQLLCEAEEAGRRVSVEMALAFDYIHAGRLTASTTFRAIAHAIDFAIDQTTVAFKLSALEKALEKLGRDHGSWRVPWGVINRFQRATSSLPTTFDDALPSVPVGLVSSLWGCLASYRSRRGEKTRLQYGVSGTGFVAAVEFGARIRALAAYPGGISSDPLSTHFNDQGDRFASANLREVHFYEQDVRDNAVATYRPGSRASAVSLRTGRA